MIMIRILIRIRIKIRIRIRIKIISHFSLSIISTNSISYSRSPPR